jgi:hypothetical protein
MSAVHRILVAVKVLKGKPLDSGRIALRPHGCETGEFPQPDTADVARRAPALNGLAGALGYSFSYY